MRGAILSLFLFAALAFGAGWTGVLVDADCKQAGKPEACPVTENSRHFGVVRDGIAKKYFTFAEEGNEKVLAAMADRQKKSGAAPTGSNVRVWFTGKPDGGKLALNDFAFK